MEMKMEMEKKVVGAAACTCTLFPVTSGEIFISSRELESDETHHPSVHRPISFSDTMPWLQKHPAGERGSRLAKYHTTAPPTEMETNICGARGEQPAEQKSFKLVQGLVNHMSDIAASGQYMCM